MSTKMSRISWSPSLVNTSKTSFNLISLNASLPYLNSLLKKRKVHCLNFSQTFFGHPLSSASHLSLLPLLLLFGNPIRLKLVRLQSSNAETSISEQVTVLFTTEVLSLAVRLKITELIASSIFQDNPYIITVDAMLRSLTPKELTEHEIPTKTSSDASFLLSKSDNHLTSNAENIRLRKTKNLYCLSELRITIAWIQTYLTDCITTETLTKKFLNFLIVLMKNIDKEHSQVSPLLAPKAISSLLKISKIILSRSSLPELNFLTNVLFQILIKTEQYDTIVEFIRLHLRYNSSGTLVMLHQLTPFLCHESIPAIDALFLERTELIPWPQLASSLQGPRFKTIATKLASAHNPKFLPSLISFLEKKLYLGHLEESILLLEEILEKQHKVRSYLDSNKLFILSQLLKQWISTPLSFVHLRVFFLFEPTSDSWAQLLLLINQQLKDHILAFSAATRLSETIVGLIEQFNALPRTAIISLINIYCRCANMIKAELYIDQLLEAGFRPDPATATVMLYGYSKDSNFNSGANFLQKLEGWGVSLNIIHFTQLIKLYTQNPRGLPGVHSVIKYIEDSGGRHQPDETTYIALIQAFIRFKQPEQLYSCIASLSRLGMSPSKKHYTSLMAYFGHNKLSKNMEHLLELVQKSNLPIDFRFVKTALTACNTCGISKKRVEALIGPQLALRSRTHEHDSAILFIKYLRSDAVALKRFTVCLLDSWAPSADPLASKQLIDLLRVIVKSNFSYRDAYLMSLIYYNMVATLLPNLGFHPQHRSSLLLRPPSLLINNHPLQTPILDPATIDALTWGLKQLSLVQHEKTKIYVKETCRRNKRLFFSPSRKDSSDLEHIQ